MSTKTQSKRTTQTQQSYTIESQGLTTFLVRHNQIEGADAYVIPPVKDMEESQKPREKMITGGPGELSARELIAVVLGVGTRKEEVMEMSTRIMHEYGARSMADQRDAQRLSETLDIPIGKACQVVACFELGRRFFRDAQKGFVTLRTPDEVAEYLSDMAHLPKEHLRGLYLNSRYQLIHDEVISIGSATENIVHPREVFKPAIEYGASAIILAHNHPSGNPHPTDADVMTTEQIVAIGHMLGISVLDHLVLAGSEHCSVPVNYRKQSTPRKNVE